MNLSRKSRRLLLFCSFLIAAPIASFAQPTPDTAALAAASKVDGMYYDALKARGKNDDVGSEKLLLQFVKDRPDNDAAWYDLSRLALRQGKLPRAMDHIKKAIVINPNNKWYREHQANIYVLGNDFEPAAKEYAELARTEKYNDEYLMKAAQLYQRAGKSKEALVQLEELRKKSGDDDDIFMLQQQIYLRMNDLDGAAKVINEMISRRPKEPKYYTQLAELYYSNRQEAKAKVAYENLRKQFPNNPDAQFALAEYYQKTGDTVQYIAYVRKVITNPTLDVETQAGLLGGYLKELNWKDSVKRNEAEVLAKSVADLHPENVIAATIYADVLRFVGKEDAANVQYRKVVELNPARYESWEQLFDRYAGPATSDSLIAVTDRARRLFPNQALVAYYNGIGHYFKKSYVDALRSLNRAIDLQPEEDNKRLSQMYTALGDVYYSMKKYTLSDSNYDHALRLYPDNASLLNNYAYYLSERKERLADAEKMSKKSLTIAPKQATFLDTYGWILYQQGDYEKALKYIQQAIDAADDDGTVWEHLGDVNYKLGKTERALEAWKKAKQLGSESPNIDRKIADKKLYE